MLKIGDKIGIVACSNAHKINNKPKIEKLLETIKDIGLIPICSKYIYEKYSIFSGSGKERGNSLMEFYKDKEIKAIFDISGGDIGNEILDYLDFQIIKKNYKPFFGYSDLTTIINSIYKKINMPSYLYQIRNLISDFEDMQRERFTNSLFKGKDDLFDINFKFIQGSNMEGIVIGGNIRCFLKLAGTPYMPDFKEKILLLESLGGGVGIMTSHLNTLKQMGVFKKVNGIILGTFTNMESEKLIPTIEEIVRCVIDDETLPIIKTQEIGHQNDSKSIIIGKKMKFI